MKIIRNYFFSAMPKDLPNSAKSFIFDQSRNRLIAGQSHPTNISKKKPKPLKSSNNEDWYLKRINDANSSDSLEASLALAEMEVFAQEYRRLICPTHLFNGKNIYTKYRLAYDEQHPDNLYVASKSLKLMGRSGDFSFDHEGTLTFKDDPTTGLNLKDIPGLGCSCLFAKILGEVDFKIQNAVIINDGLKADGTPQLYFSQIDSEWSFAGTANTKFRSLNLDTGLMTAGEVIANPYTLSKFYNYLSLIQKGTDHYQFKEFLLKTSQEPHV
ncbi:hypothetical protein EBS02_09580, partial [bacterium]|nr:hypothetical protein [bacterium]